VRATPDLAANPSLQRIAKLALAIGRWPRPGAGPVKRLGSLAEEPAQAWVLLAAPGRRGLALWRPRSPAVWAITSNAMNGRGQIRRPAAAAVGHELHPPRWPGHPAGRLSGPNPLPKTLSCLHVEPSAPDAHLLKPGQFQESQLHHNTKRWLTPGGGSWNLPQEPQRASQGLGLQGWPIAGVVLVDGQRV